MLGDIRSAQNIYIACGFTDMRKQIDGLAAMVQEEFELDPFTPSLFLFCGRRADRIKLLFWEGDGFLLMYKRLEGSNRFRWPRSPSEARPITWQQFNWLMEGLDIVQKHVIKPAYPGEFC